MMLDAVYVDMKSGEMVGVKPKPEFLPLFNLREPVKSGEVVLVTGTFEQSRTIPRTRAGYSSGCSRVWNWALTYRRKSLDV
jgi:copper(I)-binding protein